MNHNLRICDNASADLKEAAEKLHAALAAHFNDGKTVVVVKPLIGDPCLLWEHTNRTEYPSNIPMNDKGSTKGLLGFYKGVWEIDSPTTYYSKKETGIKWRIIKAPTAVEAVTKLLKWYEKNADAIKAQG